MAILTIPNIKLVGLAACVPSRIEENREGALSAEETEKLIHTTGIERRRIVSKDTCTSDLCFEAANRLIEDLGWDRNEIDALIFVTQTPDYVLPSTSPILQARLGLGTNCLSLDISLGCSGYVYGLTTLSSLMSSGLVKKGLLLVGDTISKICSKTDKSTYPLFGDAGTASALLYDPTAAPLISALFSDGKGYEAILVKDGGYRNEFSSTSLAVEEIEPGISRNAVNLMLDGMNVFSFGITQAPQAVNQLLQHMNITAADVDYFVFHQANKFMNEKIRKKLQLTVEQVPYTLKDFGNTSSATIPLTMIQACRKELTTEKLKFVLCGFGVGLSWGAVYLETSGLVCSELIEI